MQINLLTWVWELLLVVIALLEENVHIKVNGVYVRLTSNFQANFTSKWNVHNLLCKYMYTGTAQNNGELLGRHHHKTFLNLRHVLTSAQTRIELRYCESALNPLFAKPGWTRVQPTHICMWVQSGLKLGQEWSASCACIKNIFWAL